MSLGLEVLNRIDVQNNPVNWVDPWGLIYLDPNHDYRTGEKHKTDKSKPTVLEFDRGWGDFLKGGDKLWCGLKNRQWDSAFQSCIDNLERDLAKCKSNSCDSANDPLCELRAKIRFQGCVAQNNADRGIKYPNSRCF